MATPYVVTLEYFKDSLPISFRAALQHQSIVLLDMLDEAIDQVTDAAGESEETFSIAASELDMWGLPSRFWRWYTPEFLEGYKLALYPVGLKLSGLGDGLWASTAEELAADALGCAARDVLAEMPEVLEGAMDSEGKDVVIDPTVSGDAWEIYADLAFEDRDFDMLFSPEFDGIEDEVEVTEYLGASNLHPLRWFQPFNAERPVHPFLAEYTPTQFGRKAQ